MHVAGHEVKRVAVRADHVRHPEEGRKVTHEIPDESVIQASRPAAGQHKGVGNEARVHTPVQGRAVRDAVVEHVCVAVLVGRRPVGVRGISDGHNAIPIRSGGRDGFLRSRPGKHGPTGQVRTRRGCEHEAHWKRLNSRSLTRGGEATDCQRHHTDRGDHRSTHLTLPFNDSDELVHDIPFR